MIRLKKIGKSHVIIPSLGGKIAHTRNTIIILICEGHRLVTRVYMSFMFIVLCITHLQLHGAFNLYIQVCNFQYRTFLGNVRGCLQGYNLKNIEYQCVRHRYIYYIGIQQRLRFVFYQTIRVYYNNILQVLQDAGIIQVTYTMSVTFILFYHPYTTRMVPKYTYCIEKNIVFNIRSLNSRRIL